MGLSTVSIVGVRVSRILLRNLMASMYMMGLILGLKDRAKHLTVNDESIGSDTARMNIMNIIHIG
jgi:hypothetical protein